MASTSEKNGNHFRAAFTESCGELEEAIRSLDTLNKRIDAFRTSDVWLSSPILKQTSSLSTTTTTNNCFDQSHNQIPPNCATSSSSRENNNHHHFKNQQNNNNHNNNNNNNVQTLSSVEASVVLIQSLLADTQRQCTKMVDDNHLLANHLDGELGKCQEQVDSLRKELAYANRCVNDLEVNMMINGSATESDTEGQNADKESAEIQIYRLREENSRLIVQLKTTRQEVTMLKLRHHEDDSHQHQRHNGCNQQQIRLINSDQNGNNLHNSSGCVGGASLAKENGVVDDGTTKNEDLRQTLNNLQLELNQAKEALIVLKNDRKRLKSEKLELLNQMKEVYQTLESKERELRDFIRQFEQKMRDSDKGIKELIWEKDKIEKEKQKLEECLEKTDSKFVQMKTDLEREQNENAKIKAQLKELQGRFVLLTGQSATTAATCTQIPTPSAGYCSMSSTSPASMVIMQIQNDAQVLPNRSDVVAEPAVVAPTVVHRINIADAPSTSSSDKLVGPPRRPRLGRKESSSQDRNSNRFSKLFNLRRSKSKDEPSSIVLAAEADDDEMMFVVDPISADLCLAEKADQLIQARKIPFARWRQSQIIAWLELELGMGQYSKIFNENVKSGRVLMSLSDNEIEHMLNITNAMHKKKLRLAIEEYRAPSLCKFPCVKEVSTHYVCSSFLPSIGLVQYVDTFRQNLIDGRILNYLNKKQLEKYLNVTKRFHQISILKGIELLRLFNYDIKTLNKRRIDCDRENTDLLVWTNSRMIRWLQLVDLNEYAENLRDTGIHGALAVLDPSFNSDTLATALGISHSKQMIRKHLTDEFEPLQHQARTRICNAQMAAKEIHNSSPKRSGSLGRTFVRSYTVNGDQGFDQIPNNKNGFNKKRNGLRGSIGRVFGLKVKRSNDVVDDVAPMTIGDETGLPKDFMVGTSPKMLNQSTGTISSATSDLGSSIERSQHMKTILATPQVLIQPPMTGLSPTMAPAVKAFSTDKLSSGGPVTSTSATDLSRLQHLCLSPGEGNGSTKGSSVRMRQKKPVVQVRSPGANPTRPHSIGDFSQQNFHKAPFLTSLTTKSGSLFSPQRLQNWLSVDHVDRNKMQNGDQNKKPDGDQTSNGDRHMGTIVEQGEFELETDIMEYKSVGGDEIVWHNGRRKERLPTKIAGNDSPTNKSRPRTLPLRSNSVDNAKSKPCSTSLDTVHETDL